MKKQDVLRFGEAGRFVISGGVCFLIEYAVLAALKEIFHLNILTATALAFLVSVSVNYVMCTKWVFENVTNSGSFAKTSFILTSVIGMGLNVLIMWVLSRVWNEDLVLLSAFGIPFKMYLLDKAVATLLVMIWNYFSKKYVLKHNHK